MSWYILALFAHIVGVLVLFMSIALQWLITLRVRGARSITQVREWSGLARGLTRLAPVSGVLILGAGISMTAIAWSILTTWIDVSVAAMVIMMILGMGVVGRRLKAIHHAATEASSDAIPAALQARMDDPPLWIAMQMAVAVALGIVFLMTTKPSLTISIVSVLVSLALGALIGLLMVRPRRVAPAQVRALPVKGASIR
jgi:hypothetical protein